MPEFTLNAAMDAITIDEAECIILHGVAHVFGHDDLTDQVMAQATIPTPVILLRHWDWRTPIGVADVARTGQKIRVTAKVYHNDVGSLLCCPYLGLAVKIVGQEGEPSSMDYVTVYDLPSNHAPVVPPYRLTQVPEPFPADVLRDYVHIAIDGRVEWWHRDDPVLDVFFPPNR